MRHAGRQALDRWLEGPAFRWLVTACQAATIGVTWGLWQAREDPPMLPALPLPPVDLGPALLASLVLVLLRPSLGLWLHTGLVAYAMATDQTRLQPQVVSLVLLLWATAPGPGPPLVGRAHLIALWTWAGIHKLLSLWFLERIGPRLVGALVPWAPPGFLRGGGYGIAAAEIALGFLAVNPRTRRLAAGLACLFHAGIVLTLALLPRGRNVAVWPWNLALAVAGLALLVAPAGFYVGLTDAYLAHNLYAASPPGATTASVDFGAPVRAFHAILPPEPRLYAQYFRLKCRPGDTLRIDDARAWGRGRGRSERVIPCDEGTGR